MRYILSIVFLSTFLLAESVDLSVCGFTDFGDGSVHFDVCYASDFDIAGFQFNFSEVSGGADITITGASGGDATAYGLLVQNSAATVLGFAFDGKNFKYAELIFDFSISICALKQRANKIENDSNINFFIIFILK